MQQTHNQLLGNCVSLFMVTGVQARLPSEGTRFPPHSAVLTNCPKCCSISSTATPAMARVQEPAPRSCLNPPLADRSRRKHLPENTKTALNGTKSVFTKQQLHTAVIRRISVRQSEKRRCHMRMQKMLL